MSRKRKRPVRKEPSAEEPSIPAWARHLPWIITVLCALWLGSKAFRPTGKLDGMDIARFGRLPVVESGRVKPCDSLARNYLTLMSEKQDFVEVTGSDPSRPIEVKRPAIKWLLDTLSGSPAGADHQVFRIENLEVLKIIQLERRKRFRYSLLEIAPQFGRIMQEAGRAKDKQDASKKLGLTDKAFLKLANSLQRQVNLMAFLIPHILPPNNDTDWQTVGDMFAEIGKAQGLDKNEMKRSLQERVVRALRQDSREAVRENQESFLSILSSLDSEPVTIWADMLLAYQKGDAAAFNQNLDKYEKWLQKNPPPNSDRIGSEIVYNRLQPFSASAALYLIAFLLVCLAWLFDVPGDAEKMKTLGRMIFGVVCFGLLLSFVGTVLGGLWADDSWGRFWGWDPKENGALIIVLWNVLILHARLGGLVQARGLAVLVLGGNIVTAWSWFGVNQLGVGLHSYGEVSGITFWLLVFVTSQLVLIVLGCLPLKTWLLPDRPKNTQAPQWAALFNRAAFYLITLTFGVHTLALIARIYISGYPPVTTLYSSAIFIGWGAVILGLLLERFYPRQMGIGNTVAATAGYATLLIAHNLAIGDGDTFTMMQAVLDTKFWLATHVTCVTLGYTATFVAGGLGIYTLLRSNRWCFVGLGVFFLFWAGLGVVAEKKWGVIFPRMEIRDHLMDPKMIFLIVGSILLGIGCLSLYRAGWRFDKSKGASS